MDRYIWFVYLFAYQCIMDIPVNDKTITLNSEIVKFYFKYNSKFSRLASHDYVCVLHHTDKLLETIALISKTDYQITYLYDKGSYSEEQMLRIIKMKAFL